VQHLLSDRRLSFDAPRNSGFYAHRPIAGFEAHFGSTIRVESDAIDVIRILHGKRDLNAFSKLKERLTLSKPAIRGRPTLFTKCPKRAGHPLRLYFASCLTVFFAAVLFQPLQHGVTIIGRPTVASTKTSPNFPPSAGGTNLSHDTASLYGLPERPPSAPAPGRMRSP